MLCELDSTGRVTSTSTWGANGLVAKARTTYNAQGTPSTLGLLYAFDERGNTVNVVNQYGGLEDNSAFDAIGGRVWGRADSTGFGGQWGYYTDGETGLILCTLRYYDPAAQRWVTRDPIGFAGGINLYGYVANNPIGAVDPLGLIANYQVPGAGPPSSNAPWYQKFWYYAKPYLTQIAFDVVLFAATDGMGSGPMRGLPASRQPLALPAPSSPQRLFVCAPGFNGADPEVFVVPPGGSVAVTRNLKGVIITAPNGANMRIMEPTSPGGTSGKSPGYPTGYVRVENSTGQALDAAGNNNSPAGKAATHIPRPLPGPIPKWP